MSGISSEGVRINNRLNRTGNPDKSHVFFRLIDGKEHFYIVDIYGDYEDLVHNAGSKSRYAKNRNTKWQSRMEAAMM